MIEKLRVAISVSPSSKKEALAAYKAARAFRSGKSKRQSTSGDDERVAGCESPRDTEKPEPQHVSGVGRALRIPDLNSGNRISGGHRTEGHGHGVGTRAARCASDERRLTGVSAVVRHLGTRDGRRRTQR